MITISYHSGEIPLLTVLAAARMMIQFQPIGTKCLIEQGANAISLRITLRVEKDGTVSEDIDAVLNKPSK